MEKKQSPAQEFAQSAICRAARLAPILNVNSVQGTRGFYISVYTFDTRIICGDCNIISLARTDNDSVMEAVARNILQSQLLETFKDIF